MKISRKISIWLFIGVVMLFFQVVLGGITRITGSGLSITKWDIITGTIPPLNLESWIAAFELYKQTPQYTKINGHMNLSEFKFIYFWEYSHRLWARTMGFVFLFPFIYFMVKKQLSKRIIKRLSVVVLLSVFTAAFGWIMVASGLMDRPWVSAYKLGLHLLLAFITYAYLLWTYFIATYEHRSILVSFRQYRFTKFFIALLWLQIFIGGIVSGMKAGLFYNTWPSMGRGYVPMVLLDLEHWTFDNMMHYDTHIFAPSLIQFIHRNIAYILLFIGIYIALYAKSRLQTFKLPHILFGSILTLQVILGISIILTAHGNIPLFYGVLHQATAFVLLGISYFLLYSYKSDILL